MIVEAAHPAPVRFVPARARKERFALAALRSPIELREDNLSRAVEVGPMFPKKAGVLAEPMHLLDGRLWCPVVTRAGADRFREAGLAEFVDWVAGRGEKAQEEFFQRQFAGTPLVAIASDERPSATVMCRGQQTRGEDVDLAGTRGVRLDGRERARDEVARYAAEEIRILDGRPFMRSTPFLFVTSVDALVTMRAESRVWRDHPGMYTFPTTPETVDAVTAIHAGSSTRPFEEAYEAVRRHWAALVPHGALDGDDARWILSAFAEPLRRSLDLAIEAAGERRPTERLEAARRAMRGIEIASMTGTAHHAGDDAILAMREALAAWMERPRNGSHGQEQLAKFLDRVIIPRIDARAAADIDAGSLLPP